MQEPFKPVRVKVSGNEYELYLPDAATDHIQRYIHSTESPYEADVLADLALRIDADDTVIDVGANVGNHTMFLASVVGATVHAFEPSHHLAQAIRISAELNGLEKRVIVHQEALGRESRSSRLVALDKTNLGRQVVVSDDSNGEIIDVKTLDSYSWPSRIAAIKIDVEGMECDVVEGGRSLLERDRPLIYVEALDFEQFEAVDAALGPMGYQPVAMFGVSALLLFVHGSDLQKQLEPGDALRQSIRQLYRYRSLTAEQTRVLRAAQLKYRQVTEALAIERGQPVPTSTGRGARSGVTSDGGEPEPNAGTIEDLARANVHLEEVAGTAEDVIVSLDIARWRADHELRKVKQDSTEEAHRFAQEVSQLKLEYLSATREIERLRQRLMQAAEARRHLIEMRRSRDRLGRLLRAERQQMADLHLALNRVVEERDHGTSVANMKATELERTKDERLTVSAERDARSEELANVQRDLGVVQRLLEEATVRHREERNRLAAEADRLRTTLVALRGSLTYRLGAEFRDAMRSPRSAARLPKNLLEIRREARAHEPLLNASPDVSGKDASSPNTAEAPANTTVLKAGYNPPRRNRVPSDVRSNTSGLTRRPRVACILDDFSHASFAPDADLFPLTPTNWSEELERARPELLLIESAWRGSNGAWWNTVHRLGPELRGIIEWCRDRQIPFAFWNKEDPVHFGTFLNIAALADAVFTTDVDCIPRYKNALGHERVYLLPFAAQPSIHNPIAEFRRQDGIAFAGAFYARYPHRTRDLENFLSSLPTFREVVIFDRNFLRDDPDYAFPEIYEPFIVGTLSPDDVGLAYKGYAYGLNLNSVKASQTMFARRVFELMASGTVVLSNYSRGIKTLFGDLAPASDSGIHVVSELTKRKGVARSQERLAVRALRKVLSEHTYAHRLTSIGEALSLPIAMKDQSVAVVGVVHTRNDIECILSSIHRQTIQVDQILLVSCGVSLSAANSTAVPIEVLEPGDRTNLGERLRTENVAFFHADDYYGPAYLEDLLLARRYTAAPVITKGGHFAFRKGRVWSGSSESYAPTERAVARRSLGRTADVSFSSRELSRRWKRFSIGRAFAIDPFNYCEDGGIHAMNVAPEVDDIQVDTGADLRELEALASERVAHKAAESTLSLRDFLSFFQRSRHSSLELRMSGETLVMRSTLSENEHSYLYASELSAAEDLGWKQEGGHLYLGLEPTLDVQGTVIFFNEREERVGHVMVPANRNHSFELAEETVWVKFALRVRGPGEARIRHVAAAHYREEIAGIALRGDIAILTNIYPAYGDLYRNAFVHSRVRGYVESGYKVDVCIASDVSEPRYREFNGIEVVEAATEDLVSALRRRSPRALMVHFVDESTWEVVESIEDEVPVTVWIHGADIQPPWRRPSAYNSEADYVAALEKSEIKLSFWRRVFESRHRHVKFVFVSQYLAETAFEDVGVTLPSDRYAVINNPIDGDLFAYQPKKPDARRRILSIRPYASGVYANDLSVAAVLELRQEPYFGDLEFLFVGDGPLFEETLAPLRELENVEIRQGFLNQEEIAQLHKEYGVFLVPSRMDTQGVSRDEAMASGLVPVTTSVAAIPEFVDDTMGWLAETDNCVQLADGVRFLYENPDEFVHRSARAAEAVRARSGRDRVIHEELLFAGVASVHEAGESQSK